MRKLYNEFFHVSKHGKIREKVILTRVVTAVSVVVMCLAAMSFSAYAYFSHNVTSGSNIIKAAAFLTDVQVRITDTNGTSVDVITTDYKSHVVELQANQPYYVTLQHTERSTAKTGFIIITADRCNERYHTQQLGRDADGNTETVAFWLTPTADTKVTFFSHWGTSSYYPAFTENGENNETYIVNGDRVALAVKNTQSTTSSVTESTTTATQTAPAETTKPSEPTSTAEPSNITVESATQTTESTVAETTVTETTEEAAPTTDVTGTTTAEVQE